MFVAQSHNVHRNKTTLAAIQRQVRKQEEKTRQQRDAIDRTLEREKHRDERLKQQFIEAREHLDWLMEDRRRMRDEECLDPAKISERTIARLESPHSLKYIADWVCGMHRVTLREMRSHYRPKNYVHARYAFFHWAKQLTPASLQEIGNYIGKDHTTVVYATKKDAQERTRYERLRSEWRPKIRAANPSKPDWWVL